jgi:hypothetical protein
MTPNEGNGRAPDSGTGGPEDDDEPVKRLVAKIEYVAVGLDNVRETMREQGKQIDKIVEQVFILVGRTALVEGKADAALTTGQQEVAAIRAKADELEAEQLRDLKAQAAGAAAREAARLAKLEAANDHRASITNEIELEAQAAKAKQITNARDRALKIGLGVLAAVATTIAAALAAGVRP